MRVDRPPPGGELNEGEVTDAREAATLILMRDSDEGPEVLLVQRNPEQRFMGGAWVFPGGATSAEDADEVAAAIREFEEEAGVALADDHELVRFSRWITPAQVKVRFDTHFFVAEAPEDVEPTVDGEECVDWRWILPQAALDLHNKADELMLVFPTIKHLEQLVPFRTVADVLEDARARKVLPVEPRVLVDGGIAQVLLPGEDGYDD